VRPLDLGIQIKGRIARQIMKEQERFAGEAISAIWHATMPPPVARVLYHIGGFRLSARKII
jgi:hypothetical protein